MVDRHFSNRLRLIFKYLSRRLSRWIDRSNLRPEFIIFSTSILVGCLTGLGGVALHYLIELIAHFGFEVFPGYVGNIQAIYIILVPTIGGLFVGLIILYFGKEAKGHGVPEVMEAIALKRGRIKPTVAFSKSIASALSIGSGGAVGREGPIVQIGSALGSTAGQMLKLSDDRVRNLVACGAAAGISATFNAPIAGVIFALEVILGEFTTRYFSTVVIASVSASVIGRAFFGNNPAFEIPFEYGINNTWEYLFYPVLGVLAAIVAVLFVRILYKTEDLFDEWKGVPAWIKPGIGGALLGVLGLAYPYFFSGLEWEGTPHVFGAGYQYIEAALSNSMGLKLVAMLMVLKLIASSLTLGSGGSGGVFAPGLFMGAMLGASFELVARQIFPEIVAPAGAYALVGMGAVFAASSQAPITAVLILFELTGNYQIILPLMLSVVVATLLARNFLRGESIYSLKLTRRGVRLKRGRDVDILEGVKVRDVMEAEIDTSVTPDMALPDLSNVFASSRHHGLIVKENGKLWGIVTVTDLDQALNENMPPSTKVADIGVGMEDLLVAYPDETIGEVLNRMSTRGLGRLPVVDRHDRTALLGLIRRNDMVKAYNIALSKRYESRHRQQQQALEKSDDTQFVELSIKSGSPCVGKKVSEVACDLPKDSILIYIRQNGQVIIPHGETILKEGHELTAFARKSDIEKLKSCLCGAEEIHD